MSQKILLFMEVSEGRFKRSSLSLVETAVRLAGQMNAEVEGVVIGPVDTECMASPLGDALRKVHHVSSEGLKLYNVHSYAPALVQVVREVSPAVLLAAASCTAGDLLPRAAAAMNVTMVSDCIDASWCEDGLSVIRPVYSGKAFARLRFEGRPPFIATFRNGGSSPLCDTGGPACWNSVDYAVPSEMMAETAEITCNDMQAEDVAEADVVVSGGRGLRSASDFAMLREIAEKLGGAVGASRAAVDEGHACNDMQVGQTGKSVSPRLYMAFGISGAAQHLAGMTGSKVIVAINRDPEAPIFKAADYGIVGDIYGIGRELKAALEGA